MTKGLQFGMLDEELATVRDKRLETITAAIEALHPGEEVAFDDRTLKPIQQYLGVDPEKAQVEAAEVGFAEILQREHDLDWVTVETDDGPEIGLNIPMTENIILLSEIFEKSLGAGKPANLLTTYMEWNQWVGEHAFD